MRSHSALVTVLLTLACLFAPSDLAGSALPPGAAVAPPAQLRFSGEITVLWRDSFAIRVFDPAYRPAHPIETLLIGFGGRLRPCFGVPGARSVTSETESPGIEPAGAGFLIRWPQGGRAADLWAWCAG
jgi:hypothetical protein